MFYRECLFLTDSENNFVISPIDFAKETSDNRNLVLFSVLKSQYESLVGVLDTGKIGVFRAAASNCLNFLSIYVKDRCEAATAIVTYCPVTIFTDSKHWSDTVLSDSDNLLTLVVGDIHGTLAVLIVNHPIAVLVD